MDTLWLVCFWGSLIALAYVYAGFPAIVALVGKLFPRRWCVRPITPPVSLIIAAYNEEEAIAQRLENALELDYPKTDLQIIVASDGSTDATEKIVERYAALGMCLLRLPRRGKIFAITDAVRHATGEILVFSDANSMYDRDAVRMLAQNFADPEVGGVVGHTSYRLQRGCESSGEGESLYWNYDTWIKQMESLTGSVISAHGGMYAIRRQLFPAITDPSVTDDFAISTAVIEAGKRLVFESGARGWEATMAEAHVEFARRVRLMTRGFRSVLLRRRLLNPFRSGFYALVLFTHKVLRRLMAGALVALFIASLLLSSSGKLYAAAAAAQILFYALACAGFLLRKKPQGHAKILYVPFFYCIANLASLLAFFRFVGGRRVERWEPQRHSSGERSGNPPTTVPGQSLHSNREPEKQIQRQSGQGCRPPSIVIGLDCMTGLQTAHLLAYRHGLPVIGIARNQRHPCSRTRSCREILFADTGGQGLIDLLERLGPRLSAPGVLYPCSDLSVLQISRFRDRLQPWYRIVLPAPEVVEQLVDKGAFYRFARKHRFALPETSLLQTGDDAEEAARRLHFPAILKPTVKSPDWEKHISVKTFRVQNAEELRALYARCSAYAEALLVQEWVDGDDSSRYTCNCYFGTGGEPLVTFVTRKLRDWPPETGTGCFGQECRNDFVLEETVRFFRAAHHKGFGYLEMKLDAPSGRYLLIEPNIGRPTGRSATAEAAGVDFLFTQYCDALGLPLPQHRSQKYGAMKWIYLRRDTQAALVAWKQGRLSLSDWARSLRGPKVEALFSWRDPLPFVFDLLKGVSVLLKGRKTAVTARAGSGRVQVSATPRCASTVDFDIHGLAGIRLVNPSESDAAAVRRQLGPLEAPLFNPPDITVRFVDEIPVGGLRYAGVGRSGFTADGFFILQNRKQPTKVRIDFSQIGGPCEIVCETGISAVPFLLAILNMTLLTKDCVPLHASAFLHRGTGVVVTGWAKGGKTEALLAFTRRGARYVGDEWVLLKADGSAAYGIPEQIRLQQWHLKQLPDVQKHVRVVDRVFFGTIGLYERLQGIFPHAVVRRSPLLQRLRAAVPALHRQLNAQFDPRKVFGDSLGPFSMVPRKVFFMMSWPEAAIKIEPADSTTIADHMCASNRYEQLPFFSDYLAYLFAFPDRVNNFIECAHVLQRSLLRKALAGKEAYVVRHPYPCSLDELYECMSPFCEAPVQAADALTPQETLASRFARPTEVTPI